MIFSDSLSVLRALQDPEPKHVMVRTLQHGIDEEKVTGKNIQLCWVPGHVGIKGNERADRRAREATKQYKTFFATPYRDVYPLVNEIIKKRWKIQWESKRQKLAEVRTELGEWSVLRGFTRREQVIINRMRTGHTHMTHSYLMDRDANGMPPLCHYCQDAILTVKHVMLRCEALRLVRVRCFTGYNEQNTDLKSLLGEEGNLREVIAFLRDTGMYSKI